MWGGDEEGVWVRVWICDKVKLKVEDGGLWYGKKGLGPDTALFVDATGDTSYLEGREGVIRLPTPERIDMLMCVGERVVGVESKKPKDLLSSHASRRLARQFRTMFRMCDISCLLLRGPWPTETYDGEVPYRLYDDLVRFQMLGGIILPGDGDVVKDLARWKPILAGGRTVLAAVAGTDERTERGGRGWLLRCIKGVGPKLSERLLDKFGSTMVSLCGDDNSWSDCGASKAVLRNRREALNDAKGIAGYGGGEVAAE